MANNAEDLLDENESITNHLADMVLQIRIKIPNKYKGFLESIAKMQKTNVDLLCKQWCQTEIDYKLEHYLIDIAELFEMSQSRFLTPNQKHQKKGRNND